MKKIALMLALILLLSSCAKKEPAPEPAPEPSQSVAPSEPEPEEITFKKVFDFSAETVEGGPYGSWGNGATAVEGDFLKVDANDGFGALVFWTGKTDGEFNVELGKGYIMTFRAKGEAGKSILFDFKDGSVGMGGSYTFRTNDWETVTSEVMTSELTWEDIPESDPNYINGISARIYTIGGESGALSFYLSDISILEVVEEVADPEPEPEPEPSQSVAPSEPEPEPEPEIIYEYNYSFSVDEIKELEPAPKKEIITASRYFDYYNKELKPSKKYGELFVFAGGKTNPRGSGWHLQPRYGLVNEKGQVVVESVFDRANQLTVNNKDFYVLQYPMDYDKGQQYKDKPWEDKSASVRLDLNDTVITNIDGSKVVSYSMVDRVYEFDGNIAVVYETAGTGQLYFCVDMLDTELKVVGSYKGGGLEVGMPSEGLMSVKCDGYGCYIDNTGKVKVKTDSFDGLGEFHNGYARVWNWGERLSDFETCRMYGFIDTTGKVVIPLEYYDASHFNEYGYATVNEHKIFFMQEGSFGRGNCDNAVINKSNEKVFTYKYDGDPEDEKFKHKITLYGNVIKSKGKIIDLKTQKSIKCPACKAKWDEEQMVLFSVNGTELNKCPYICHTGCPEDDGKIFTLEGEVIVDINNFSGYEVSSYVSNGKIRFNGEEEDILYDVETGKAYEIPSKLSVVNDKFATEFINESGAAFYRIYNLETGVSTGEYAAHEIFSNGYTGIIDDVAYVYNSKDELIAAETVLDFHPLI